MGLILDQDQEWIKCPVTASHDLVISQTSSAYQYQEYLNKHNGEDIMKYSWDRSVAGFSQSKRLSVLLVPTNDARLERLNFGHKYFKIYLFISDEIFITLLTGDA